jgi:hypothetical protein
MRRGLIEWSKTELPESVFDTRLARLRDAMKRDRVDAVVAYTNFTRPSAVSWLCGFIPYWSECILLVPHEGATTLISALSPRGKPWIASTAYADELIFAPKVGAEAARVLGESLPAGATIGVIELDDIPAAIGLALAGLDATLRDLTDAFAVLRCEGDAAQTALARKAAEIAHDALAAVPPGETSAAAAIALVDRTARGLGAEECYVAVTPDLQSTRHFVRLEGDAQLGAAFALRATVAYKGAWIRMIRSIVRDDVHGVLTTGAQRFADAIAALPQTGALDELEGWLVETARAAEPLAAIAGSGIEGRATFAPGVLVTVQATAIVDGLPLAFGSPVLAGSDHAPATFLVNPQF